MRAGQRASGRRDDSHDKSRERRLSLLPPLRNDYERQYCLKGDYIGRRWRWRWGRQREEGGRRRRASSTRAPSRRRRGGGGSTPPLASLIFKAISTRFECYCKKIRTLWKSNSTSRRGGGRRREGDRKSVRSEKAPTFASTRDPFSIANKFKYNNLSNLASVKLALQCSMILAVRP